MDVETWEEISACLPQGRKLFLYERDRYAVMLLRWLLRAGADIRDLRSGRFARLFDKPPLRDFLASRGRAELGAGDLELAPMTRPVGWRLGFDRWGVGKRNSGLQTSRGGVNIVLQLNFSRAHDEAFDALVGPCAANALNYRGHPVARGDRTLAWSRIDLDMTCGEALIEEIQSDWMRNMHWALGEEWKAAHVHSRLCAAHGSRFAELADFHAALRRYERTVLAPIAGHWQETMMAATLSFLVEELGMRRIFMHQFDTGNLLKRIGSGALPPRSIYTDLPRRFCFAKVGRGPAFLDGELSRLDRKQRAAARALGELGFWRLDLTTDTMAGATKAA